MKTFARQDVIRAVTMALLLPVLIVGCSVRAIDLSPMGRSEEVQISEAILGYFEERLWRLSPHKQAHFATRLFRTTGERKYIRPIIFHLLSSSGRWLFDIARLNDPDYMERRYELSYDSLSEGTELKRSRKRFWTDWKKEIYDHSLARAMYKWKQFGLADTRCQKDFLLALDYLRSGDSRKFYLSQDVIQNHPTRVVNGVNYLYYLGITDLRSQLRDAFTEAYAGKIDSLSEMEFQDMIYGLTHFIIGGSNYYQQFCSSDEYFWILNIFRKYIGKITTSCTPDAIAEVGLCFRLCQVSRESIPHEISWALSAAFAKGKGYIPRNSHDLDSLEHRNVIAYLYFCNFNNLYPGPNLGREEKYRDLLEAQCGLMERRGEDVAIPSANVVFPVWRAPFNRTTGASASAACNSSSIFRLYMVEYLPSYGELFTIIHIGQSENPENGKSPEPDTHRSPLPLFGKLAVLRFSPA